MKKQDRQRRGAEGGGGVTWFLNMQDHFDTRVFTCERMNVCVGPHVDCGCPYVQVKMLKKAFCEEPVRQASHQTTPITWWEVMGIL